MVNPLAKLNAFLQIAQQNKACGMLRAPAGVCELSSAHSVLSEGERERGGGRNREMRQKWWGIHFSIVCPRKGDERHKTDTEGEGRGVPLSTQHLLQASATDWQGVLICIYLIKMMHNSFPKQEKTHAFGNPFTHFLLSALLFESLRNGAGDFFDPACGESLCGFIRSPPGVYLFIFPNNRLLRPCAALL